MANYSFTNQGATPQQPNVFGGQMSGSTTPVAKALNSASDPSFSGLINRASSGSVFNVGTQQPTTPVKSTTQTNVDGSSNTTTYHAPGTATPQYNASSGGTPGLVNPAQNQASVTPGGGIAQGSQPQTFQGLLGTVAGQGSQQNPVTQQGLSTAQNAANTYNTLNKQIGDTRLAEADALAHQGLAPIPMGDIMGRQAVIRNQYEQRLAGLGAQAQGATALFGPGFSAATTGQGQQFGAAQSALGASQPQLGAYGQTYYQPTQAGQQQGGNYGTGPAAAANVQSIQDQTKLVNDWSAARQSANQIGNQLQSFLQTNAINPADFNAVNKFLQAIGAQTSSPQYKQFYNLVTDLANTYAPVLSTSGDATNYKTQLAQSLLDGTAAGKSIPQILAGLDQQAQGKIAGLQQNIQNLNTGGQVNPPTLAGPAGTAGGIWNW